VFEHAAAIVLVTTINHAHKRSSRASKAPMSTSVRRARRPFKQPLEVEGCVRGCLSNQAAETHQALQGAEI